MIGLAAELSGARLCISEAMATLACVFGTMSYTCSKSKIMYGDQQRTKTETNYEVREFHNYITHPVLEKNT